MLLRKQASVLLVNHSAIHGQTNLAHFTQVIISGRYLPGWTSFILLIPYPIRSIMYSSPMALTKNGLR